MPQYRLAVPIHHASGTRWFLVDAESKAEAIHAFHRGDATFEGDDILVTGLGKVDESDVEEVDDDE